MRVRKRRGPHVLVHRQFLNQLVTSATKLREKHEVLKGELDLAWFAAARTDANIERLTRELRASEAQCGLAYEREDRLRGIVKHLMRYRGKAHDLQKQLSAAGFAVASMNEILAKANKERDSLGELCAQYEEKFKLQRERLDELDSFHVLDSLHVGNQEGRMGEKDDELATALKRAFPRLGEVLVDGDTIYTGKTAELRKLHGRLASLHLDLLELSKRWGKRAAEYYKNTMAVRDAPGGAGAFKEMSGKHTVATDTHSEIAGIIRKHFPGCSDGSEIQ